MTATTRRISPRRRTLARFLDPVDALVQGIYSVLIILTFTLAARVVGGGEAEPALLWTEALGAAVAWGLIDGVMYLLTCRFERGQQRRLSAALRRVADEEEGVAVLAEELDEVLEPIADRATRQGIYHALYQRSHGAAPPMPNYAREDILGALIVVSIGVGAASPLLLPLVVFSGNPEQAVRLSNLVAFGSLFAMGYGWARYAGGNPLRTGFLLLLIGVGMVGIAIPLGG